MKKKMACLLVMTMLLTGCSSNDTDVLTYEPSFDSSIAVASVDSEELFASNLCVVSETDLDKSDSVMTSSASLIFNRTKNEIVYANNIYERLYPASITKIVTALVALKEGNASDEIEISHTASHITEVGAKLCGFNEGDKVSFTTLLNSLLIYSGNDAGIAMAEYIAGSEEKFSERMNEEVRKLGATHSHFVNSHGLHDENHYTTAYDIYLIFNELLNYDEFKAIIDQGSYKAEYTNASGQQVAKIFPNTNQYLIGATNAPEDVTVLGGKTGTTNAAGSCLVLLSTDENGDEYISLVLNAASKADLYNQMNHLLDMIHSK